MKGSGNEMKKTEVKRYVMSKTKPDSEHFAISDNEEVEQQLRTRKSSAAHAQNLYSD